MYSGKRDCIRGKWLYLGKVGVIGQTLLYSGKVVVFVQKWFCNSVGGGCIRYKLFYSIRVVVIR